MLIAINANELCSPEINGVKSYTYNLLKALIDLNSRNKFILYSKKEFQKKFQLEISENKKFFHKIIRWPFLFWTYFRFPLELWRDKPDVLFMPIQTIPLITNLHKLKIVVTVHDLAFLKFPNDFTFKNRLKLSWNTKRAIKKAAKIIVPSQATKKDIVEYYKVDERKIKVIYHGINYDADVADTQISKSVTNPPYPFRVKCGTSFCERGNNKYKIRKPYILFVGIIQPRKNIQGLIKAFEIFKKSYKFPACHRLERRRLAGRQVTNYKLIIVGGKGWLSEKIFKKAKKSKFSSDIIFTGQVLPEELLEIYQNAEVFVLPSFYEGFGLPILEAMANSVLVIAGNNSSMSEIVGNAGILINPNNPEEIAEAIKKIIQDKNFKEKLVKNGLKQARKFSWQKCAKETMKVLTDL